MTVSLGPTGTYKNLPGVLSQSPKPGTNSRPELCVCGPTENRADVVRREKEIMGIVTVDQSKKGLAGLRGNQIIVGADDVKHGTGDLLQVDRLTTDNQAVSGEEVALQDLVGQLTGYLTGQGNVTDEPSRKPRAGRVPPWPSSSLLCSPIASLFYNRPRLPVREPRAGWDSLRRVALYGPKNN